MKRVFLSVACLVFFAACNNPESSESAASTDSKESTEIAEVNPADAPVFKFEKDAYDFGEIKEGEKVSYDFKFKNIGNSPLIITSATATCGCTVPEYPKGPVAPGEEGVLHVVFNSAGKPGMQHKVISITANTVPSLTELSILGNVVEAKAN